MKRLVLVPGWLAGLYRFDEIVIDRRFLQQFRTLGSPQRAAESITLPADAPTVSIGDRP